MLKNKYSIIVPIFNCERYLEKCINSIISQTYTNIEIVLIDDGSTDNSGSICDEYAKKDNRIRVIHKKNEGVSIARNQGIKLVCGDYIMFADSDDYIDKDTVEKLNEKIEKEKCDIIKYAYIKEYRKLRRKYNFSIKTNIKIHKKDYIDQVIPYIFSTYDLSNVWNAVYKKEVISNIEFDKNFKYGEDFKFMIQALLNSESIYFFEEHLYHYIYNSDSAINKKTVKINTKKLIDFITSYMNIEESIYYSERGMEQMNERVMNTNMIFFADVAKGKSYNSYLENVQEIIGQEELKELEKKYYEFCKLKLFNNILQETYYKKLKKYNLKSYIKSLILK